MIIVLSTLLFINVNCPEVNMVNKSLESWNDHDNKTVKVCKIRCKSLYGENACLVKFIKKSPKNYYAFCGLRMD